MPHFPAQDKNPVLQGATFSRHRHSTVVGQGDLRIEGDGVAGPQPQPVAPGDGGDDQVGLHQREAVADAHSWPAAEGHVGELGQSR